VTSVQLTGTNRLSLVVDELWRGITGAFARRVGAFVDGMFDEVAQELAGLNSDSSSGRFDPRHSTPTMQRAKQRNSMLRRFRSTIGTRSRKLTVAPWVQGVSSWTYHALERAPQLPCFVVTKNKMFAILCEPRGPSSVGPPYATFGRCTNAPQTVLGAIIQTSWS
jgi:hypothetical protein